MKCLKLWCVVSFVASGLLADMNIEQAMKYTLQNNPDIISKKYNDQAYEEYINEKKGSYLPTLDLSGSLQTGTKKQEYFKGPQDGSKHTSHPTGPSVQLALKQAIFDKSKYSQVGLAERQQMQNKLKNLNDVETVLLNSIDSYLDIVKFQERIKATKDFLATLDKNYEIAKKTEQINKEILDKVQTKAKILSAQKTLLSEENNLVISKSYFYKNTRVKADGNFIAPDIASKELPDLDTLKQEAMENNFAILSQKETIKKQAESISAEESGYYPTLYLKLSAAYDKDISNEDIETTSYNAKLDFNYNIFNGFINKTRVQRERIFALEAQSELNTVSDLVINNLTTAHSTYISSKRQLEKITELIETNEQIVVIYEDQFNSGTRGFIDLLDVQMDLYNAKKDLINTRKTMYESYYKVLNILSALQKTFTTADMPN